MGKPSYKDLFSLEGRMALVTGGAGLLGKEIVKGLCDFGARVYVADPVEDGSPAKNDRISHLPMDVTSEESIRSAITSVMNENGTLDVFVNSAYPRTKDWGLKFENIRLESWKTNVNDQLGGYFSCCQMIAEHMKKQGGGSIVNLGSTYGVVAPDFSIYQGTDMTMPAAYAAIKGGSIAFTKYLATYYAKHGIRANTVSPGGIFDNQPSSFVQRYAERTPLGRMGTADEIVGAVIFLASDASRYVTGQNIVVDGGWTAW